jgi:formylglycine-generating enzyme required for sulfatase activity
MRNVLGLMAAMAGILILGNLANADTVAVQKQMSLDLGGGQNLKLIEIPPGKFLMGSPESEPLRKKDETQHQVTISRPFFLGVYLVTVDQYAQFVKETGYETDAEREGFSYGHDIKDGKIQYHHQDFAIKGCDWRNPSIEQKGNYPVVQMSWNDSKAFCDWLSRKSGKNVTLPTEAQYEYACRAGATTAYPWGDSPDDGQGWANVGDQTYKNSIDNAPANAVYFNWDDGYAFTSPVGMYKPNAFGLYDMIGNVWEWCADWYAPFTKDPVTDPMGPPTGKNKVAHGGSYIDPPKMCRCAARGKDGPKARGTMGGFRVAVSS